MTITEYICLKKFVNINIFSLSNIYDEHWYNVKFEMRKGSFFPGVSKLFVLLKNSIGTFSRKQREERLRTALVSLTRWPETLWFP